MSNSLVYLYSVILFWSWWRLGLGSFTTFVITCMKTASVNRRVCSSKPKSMGHSLYTLCLYPRVWDPLRQSGVCVACNHPSVKKMLSTSLEALAVLCCSVSHARDVECKLDNKWNRILKMPPRSLLWVCSVSWQCLLGCRSPKIKDSFRGKCGIENSLVN